MAHRERAEGAARAARRGDRSVRARLLGITWESSGGGGRLDGSARRGPVGCENKPRTCRRSGARRGAHRDETRRSAAWCSGFREPGDACGGAAARSILASGVDGAAAFLEERIAEMWGETPPRPRGPEPTASRAVAGARRRGGGTGPGRTSPIATTKAAPEQETPLRAGPTAVVEEDPPRERAGEGAPRIPPGRRRRRRERGRPPPWSQPPAARADLGGARPDPAPGSPDSRAARAEGDRERRAQDSAAAPARSSRWAGLRRDGPRAPPGTSPGGAPQRGSTRRRASRATRAPRHGHVLHPSRVAGGLGGTAASEGDSGARGGDARHRPAPAEQRSAATSPAAVGAAEARATGGTGGGEGGCTARRTAALAERHPCAWRRDPSRRGGGHEGCVFTRPGSPARGEPRGTDARRTLRGPNGETDSRARGEPISEPREFSETRGASGSVWDAPGGSHGRFDSGRSADNPKGADSSRGLVQNPTGSFSGVISGVAGSVGGSGGHGVTVSSGFGGVGADFRGEGAYSSRRPSKDGVRVRTPRRTGCARACARHHHRRRRPANRVSRRYRRHRRRRESRGPARAASSARTRPRARAARARTRRPRRGTPWTAAVWAAPSVTRAARSSILEARRRR